MGPLQKRDEGNRISSQKRAASKPIRAEHSEEEKADIARGLTDFRIGQILLNPGG